MSMSDSVERKEEKPIQKIAHPTIGEIYCLNEAEARGTLHEICTDKLYFQEGVYISPGDIVFDVGATLVSLPCARRSKERISTHMNRFLPPSKCYSITSIYTAWITLPKPGTSDYQIGREKN
jgi:hypothetical protein